MPSQKTCFIFIDAANLFYGGQKSLGWSIDYKKLVIYLKNKFKAKKIFYYAGIDLGSYNYDPLSSLPINLNKVLHHYRKKIINKNN